MKRISIIVGCMVLLVVGILVFANQSQEQILVEEGTKNENTSLVFMLQKEDGTYSKSDSLPSSGYSFNATKSVCSNGATPTWEDNKLYLNNLTSNGTSCYLYFDIKPLAMNTILANSTVHEGTSDFSQVATTDEGVWTAEDDLGTSYYFRGAVENNYLKFAGYWWRIIRINGDGSIRIIYDGTSAHANGESSSDRQTGTNEYNNAYNDNTYIGYMFGGGSNNYLMTHSNVYNSRIKDALDNWFETNILNENLSLYISTEVGFCNDRSIASNDEIWWNRDTKRGYATNATAYGPFSRILTSDTAWKNIQNPILKCININNDFFTVNESSIGNKSLTYPIGLITSDEVIFAGGKGGTANQDYYLYTGQNYWTISPYFFDDFNVSAYVFGVSTEGWLSSANIGSIRGVRPVINLSADVSLTGTGTMSDPYVVEGAE